MSYSDHTTNYELPQFLTSDKGNWFDLNTAFVDIDTGMQANKISAEAANTTANAAKNTAQAAQEAVNTIQNQLPTLQLKTVSNIGTFSGQLNCKTYGKVISIYGNGTATKSAATGSGENIEIGLIQELSITNPITISNAGTISDSAYQLHPLIIVLSATNNGTKITISGQGQIAHGDFTLNMSACILN